MKKFIGIIGLFFLLIVFVLNLLFTASLSSNESISIHSNSFLYIICLIFFSLFVFFITKKVNCYLYKNKSIKTRFFILFFVFIVYVLFTFLWNIFVNPLVVGDQLHVCNLAQAMNRGKVSEFLFNESYAKIPIRNYLKAYPQQITLAFVYFMFFKLLTFDIMEFLRFFNIISNILTIIALYKIAKHLSKDYQINIFRLFSFIFTFVSLLMLSTFVYGDILCMPFALFSVYFIMKYTESKKIKYAILSSVFMMISYMIRMNSLIFIIAIVLYLVINLIKDFKSFKISLLNLFVILLYICVSIFPSKIIETSFFYKYNLTNLPSYPRISYFLMGIEESKRGNGWYNEDISEEALIGSPNIENLYLNKIKVRLIYFSKNINYTFNFFIKKLASMWTENTYSAIKNNNTKNYSFDKYLPILTFYQKAILIMICLCCFIVLIQNRNNLSFDIILLLTIFIGGFVFHLFWEAKSRYIIPYIIILFPIASININALKTKK